MRWRNAARANLTAVAESVTSKSAGLAGNNLNAVSPGLIAWIGNKIQSSVQRHGTNVAPIQRDHGARRITGAAVNALRLMIHPLPFLAVLRNGVKTLSVEVVTRNEMWNDTLIRGEERFHVHGDIANHRQISQRLDAKIRSNGFDERAASELLSAINHHRA